MVFSVKIPSILQINAQLLDICKLIYPKSVKKCVVLNILLFIWVAQHNSDGPTNVSTILSIQWFGKTYFENFIFAIPFGAANSVKITHFSFNQSKLYVGIRKTKKTVTSPFPAGTQSQGNPSHQAFALALPQSSWVARTGRPGEWNCPENISLH